MLKGSAQHGESMATSTISNQTEGHGLCKTVPLSALDKEETYGTKLHVNKIHAVFYYNLYCMKRT